jgi:Tol biopolymer transport system component
LVETLREDDERLGLGPSAPLSTPVRRAPVALVSLAVAGTSFISLLGTFSGHEGLVRSLVPVTDAQPSGWNGSIYYRLDTDDGRSMVGAVEPDGSGQRIVISEDTRIRYEQLAFSPDGTHMVYVDATDGHRGIYVADSDGSDAVRLTDGINDSWPAWSPDGSKIAFVSTRFDPSVAYCHPGVYVDCVTEIYVMDRDGSDVARLTTDLGVDFNPAWSPDGTRIAYTHTPNSWTATAIQVIGADGANSVRVSSSNGGSDLDPSWSPNGDQIVFGGIHYENWGLFSVRPDGGDERTLLFGIGTYAIEPAWSPDGSLIAFGGYVKGDTESPGVYVMQADGSGVTRIADAPEGWWVREITWGPSPHGAPPAVQALVTHSIELRTAA